MCMIRCFQRFPIYSRFSISNIQKHSIRNPFNIVSKLNLLFRMSANGEENSTRSFKIYTRTGDNGTSSLYSGERRPKTDMIFEALGSTDELSSYIGLSREFCNEEMKNDQEKENISQKLIKIQCLLQDIGSNIATPRSSTQSEFKLNKTTFDVDGKLVKEVEDWIDELDSRLPVLKTFILPSGGKAASSLHIARSICRRAERRVYPVVDDGIADVSVGKYLNRLSDFLFVAARFVAQSIGKSEQIYKKI